MTTQLLRWAGSKARIVREICDRLPDRIDTYVEPFAGGAAVFFELARRGTIKGGAILGDANPHLINFYEQVRGSPGTVHTWIGEFSEQHGEAFFYELRRSFNSRAIMDGPGSAWRAAAFWYLNHACFNALWRVHQKTGHFNVPWGRKKAVRAPALEDLQEYGKLLQRADLVAGHYCDVLVTAADLASKERGAVVAYLDPPYINTFKTYDKAFIDHEHRCLSSAARQAAAAGAYVLLSINDVLLARELYDDGACQLHPVAVRHCIGAKEDRRGDVAELLIEVRV